VPALQNVPINCLNGDVALPFGSPAFIGLGFAVFAMIVVLELFGSPFMRNVEVIIALLVGYMIAGIATYDGKKVRRRRQRRWDEVAGRDSGA
jgi:xanthine/uracil permease